MLAKQVRGFVIERDHHTGGIANADRDRTIVMKFTAFQKEGCRHAGCDSCYALGHLRQLGFLNVRGQQAERTT